MENSLISPIQPSEQDKFTRECLKQDIKSKAKTNSSALIFEQILKAEIDKQEKMCKQR